MKVECSVEIPRVSPTRETPQPRPKRPSVDSDIQNPGVPPRGSELFKKFRLTQAEFGAGFHGGPSARRRGYQLALWSWLASFVDALVLVACSCAFILVFSVLVNSSLGHLFSGLHWKSHRLLFFAEIYAISGWIYLISIRSLIGFTLGEWACNLRLGQPHERLQTGYVLRVILRSTLILVTGMITLPLLSLLLGKDIPGICSGLRLFSLK